MFKLLLLCVCCCFLERSAIAGDDGAANERASWESYKQKPVTENNFHAVCDLLQQIGKTDIDLSYQILSEYVPMVRKTGNKAWIHILLMGWAKAKESLTSFADADSLYRLARANAAGDPRRYDEALVGTVLLYAEWGRADSLDKYVKLGREAAEKTSDRENLSFIYTFGAVAADMTDTAAMGRDLRKAIELARALPDKNALFTALYNYASIYWRYNPQEQVSLFQSLLELADDSTLSHKPRLYERTAFVFRNARPNIYLQLMQVNLLLADYDNAWKFGELLYNTVVKPNPSAPQAPFFDSELAMIKAYQGEYDSAKGYLDKSRLLFKVPVEKIPYPSYFLAAGMVLEHEGRYEEALRDYEAAWKMGAMEGVHLMPSALYYAHGLILVNRLEEAEKVLASLRPDLPARTYTAYGYYYYQHLAELLKAKGDDAGYGKALETFYSIKDSLTSLNHYRAIQEIEARVRVKDKEREIIQMNAENAARAEHLHLEHIYTAILLGLSGLSTLLLVGYARNKMREMEKQHQIEVMQGAIDAEEQERHKIADQLHDEVGGLLSLATLNLSSAMEKEANDLSEIQLQKTQDILHSISTTVREISHRLTPLAIEKNGFRKAVEELVDTVNLSQKLHIEAVIMGFEQTDRYPKAFLNDVYRMIQEIVQNILRHAKAQKAILQLVEHEQQVSILAEDNGIGIREDNGIGIREDNGLKGKGLASICSKIAYLEGQMEISRKNEGGTLIVIELPLARILPQAGKHRKA